MPRIRLYVDTGFNNATHEDIIDIEDDEWSAMSKKERDDCLKELANDFMGSVIDFGAVVIE